MTNLLEIRDLCVRVDRQEILCDVNLTIPDGEVHTLLGPNGSGKTSLLMAIMGFSTYEVTRGQVFFAGEEITELDITERARLGIGIAQQRPPTIAGVRLQHILDYAVAGDSQRADGIDKLVKTAHMDLFLERDINAGLSGGEIKRAELLQLLATHPRFSMMDEPDSGVDLESLPLVGSMINTLFAKDLARPARRRAGLIITHTGHILNYVHADKAHIMMNGHIGCSGNPELILNVVSEYGYEECVRCIQERGA